MNVHLVAPLIAAAIGLVPAAGHAQATSAKGDAAGAPAKRAAPHLAAPGPRARRPAPKRRPRAAPRRGPRPPTPPQLAGATQFRALTAVNVVISDQPAAGKKRSQSFLLRLDSRGRARVKLEAEAQKIEVQVRHSGPPNRPGLTIEVSRHEHQRGRHTRAMLVEASVRLKAGARATVARLRNPNGTSTEVEVQAR